LDREGVLLKDCGRYVKARTDELNSHAKALAERDWRRYIYLGQTHTKARGNGKEDLARCIAEREGVTDGLICVFAAVESCSSFDINKTSTTRRLEVTRRRRKCLFFYFYRIDAELGLCHVRVQSWFPFEIQLWCNGREMLSRALTREGIGHSRYLNSIVACDDWDRAQTTGTEPKSWLTVSPSAAGCGYSTTSPAGTTRCSHGPAGPAWAATGG